MQWSQWLNRLPAIDQIMAQSFSGRHRLPLMAVAANGTLVCLEEACKHRFGTGKNGMKPGPTQTRSVARHINKFHFPVSQFQVQRFIDSYKGACLYYNRLAAEHQEHGPIRGPLTPALQQMGSGGLVKMFKCPYEHCNGDVCGKLIIKDVGNAVEHRSLYGHLGKSHKASLRQKQEVCVLCCRLSPFAHAFSLCLYLLSASLPVAYIHRQIPAFLSIALCLLLNKKKLLCHASLLPCQLVL